MAIVTSNNKTTDQKKNTLNAANLSQLNMVVERAKKEASSEPAESPVPSQPQIQAQPIQRSFTAESLNVEKDNAVIKTVTKPAEETAAKKRVYSDTIVLNLPKGERSEFKAFCAKYQLTMTDYIYFAMDYIRNGVEEGRLSVSRGGIKEL